jgi:hypothetical protein
MELVQLNKNHNMEILEMTLKNSFWRWGMWFVCLLSIAGTAIADTQVSGLILADTIWTKSESPYVVTKSILVNEDVTLTIEPGAVVKFDEGNSLQIDGTLFAKGTETDKIQFTKSPGNNWGYILFADTSTDAAYDENGNYVSGSILEYCIIEYGGGVTVAESGTVRMNNAHPYIHHCTIRNNASTGIHGWDLTESLRIINNTITNNSDSSSLDAAGGIWVEGGSVKIYNNFISNNMAMKGGGIHASRNDLAEIFNNTITHNSARGGGGIYLYSGSASVTHNIIMNNNATVGGSSQTYGGGIYIWFATATIANNLIGNNTASLRGGGIYNDWQWGSGVFSMIQNNIIVENQAEVAGGMGVFRGDTDIPTSVYNNAILRNTANSASGFYTQERMNQNIRYNLITGNKADTPSGTDNSVFVTAQSVITDNNIFGNQTAYELWNDNPEGSPDVNTETNWWGTNIESEVEDKIFHWVDSSDKGVVDYLPWENSPRTDTPISPPTGVSAVRGTDEITLTWAANPEGDVAGYRVFWNTTSGFPYANAVNVGNTTSYVLKGLLSGTYFITITAYDDNYYAATDDPDTIVNDNQTKGTESWYAVESETKIGQKITVTPTDHNFSDIVVGYSSSPLELIISNIGVAELIISDMVLSNIIDFAIDVNGGSNPCGNKTLTIPAGESRTVTLLFTPSSGGIKEVNLIIVSNDPGAPNTTVSLAGTGISENVDITGNVMISIAGNDNLAVTNATISLEGTAYTTTTDDNGDFIIQNVPPDTYTLIVTAENLKSIIQEITVLPGQDITFELPQMTVLTQDDLNQALLDETQKWDANNDGKIGIEEAIRALKVTSGERSE